MIRLVLNVIFFFLLIKLIFLKKIALELFFIEFAKVIKKYDVFLLNKLKFTHCQMIKKEDIFQIGKLIKPHGLGGELLFDFATDVFDETKADYFICEIDGIFVPYFIENYRFNGNNSGFVKFEGIDSNEEAKELAKVNLYLERKTLPVDFSSEDVHGTDFYVGYQITDQDGNLIGKIVAIDDSTENILFNVLSPSEDEILIPASDDYILGIDDETEIIQMEIPEGLLDLD